MRSPFRIRGHAAAVAALLIMAACSTSGGSPTVNAASAKSAADVGGMNGLIAAAKAEGQLNTIGLPTDWANFGAIISGFTSKYGISVNSTNPGAYGPDEVAAVGKLGSSSQAPDVLDLGMKVAVDNVSKGVEFFHQLKAKGNLAPVLATTANVKSGATPVAFEWDYNSQFHLNDLSTWKMFVPPTATLGLYYAQAINKRAPHPAAARLWEEYLYSDEGQNLFLRGGKRPVRESAMKAKGP